MTVNELIRELQAIADAGDGDLPVVWDDDRSGREVDGIEKANRTWGTYDHSAKPRKCYEIR